MTPLVLSAFVALTTAAPPPPTEKIDKWVPATAHLVPKETAPEGEGYFSIIEGHNGKLYVGTHANGVNAWLVEFDPKTKEMKLVVDCHKAIGKDLKGFGSQAKIHTRNNVGASGKIYFGTKQGYPNKDEKREDYPGGYPMVYDPKTGETKVYDIPVKHHGINSITPDESRGVAYISTCSDGRPGPGESSIFLVLDLKTGKYRELIDTKHIYGFIVLDHLGRAYHPLLGGEIARYDPKTDKLEKLKQTIDGKEPKVDPNLVEKPRGHPINWDASPDGKTLYCVPMSSNHLYAYDLTATGNTLPGRTLGVLVQGAKGTDCRAMCVGPKGVVWVSVTRSSVWGTNLHHMVSYAPGDKAPKDHGPVAIKNPDYTKFTDAAGKALPHHAGTFKTPEGVLTSRYVTLGVCQTKAGGVYVLMLSPYTVLEIAPDAVPTASKVEEPKPEPGTVELFNGKDLTGWGYKSGDKFESFDGKPEASDKRYSVKDGILVVNPGKGTHQLWTAAKFPKDFELRLEFRAAVNADSGLFVRGPQLQVRDYLVAGPYKELKKYKAQEWNEIVVVVKGEVAHCTCNGEVLSESLKVPATGPIGLEADRGQMEYRKIRLKELK